MRQFKKFDWSISLALLFTCVLTVIAACVEPSGPLGAPNLIEVERVSSVQLTLAQSALAPGQTTQASVVARASDGRVVSGRVDFLSQNPAIATVSSNGVVAALTAGVAMIQATVGGAAGTASVTVQPLASAVAVVAVTLDSTTLQVGHVAQALATATDTAGRTIAAPTVTWTSLTPGVATVSSSGAVRAVAEGAAFIQATVSGIAGADSLIVVVPPDRASQNFDGGSYTPYYNYWDPAVGGNGAVDVVDDPTGAGKGKVARFHYARTTGGDSNRYLQIRDTIGFGTTRYAKGEFYLDAADLGSGLWGRKLIYIRPRQNETKYGGVWREFAVVFDMQGNDLRVVSFYVPAAGPGIERSDYIAFDLLPRTWYTLEVQLTPETSIGAGNGKVRVWLNGALIYDAINIQWTDPAWIGVPVPGGNGTPYELADVYFDRVEFGNQVNLNAAGFDEYRYWDNLAVSTKRIGQ